MDLVAFPLSTNQCCNDLERIRPWRPPLCKIGAGAGTARQFNGFITRKTSEPAITSLETMAYFTILSNVKFVMFISIQLWRGKRWADLKSIRTP
jgi:hypothetical protein